MLIRSQNKEVLTNLNALAGIEIVEGPVETVITSYITGCSYLLGEYSNKQKAVKVLDMLQKAYAEYEMLRLMSAGMGGIEVTSYEKVAINELEKKLQKKTIFQMPEDSEVEMLRCLILQSKRSSIRYWSIMSGIRSG